MTTGRANVVEAPDEPSGRRDRADANGVEEGGRPAAADEGCQAHVELGLAGIRERLDLQAERGPVRARAAASGRVDCVGVRSGRSAHGNGGGQGRRDAAEGATFDHHLIFARLLGDANYVRLDRAWAQRAVMNCPIGIDWTEVYRCDDVSATAVKDSPDALDENIDTFGERFRWSIEIGD